jgi:hypothetical protein
MRWVGNVAQMGEERKVYKVLERKPEGKSPLEIPRHRWVDGVKMDLREISWDVVEWVHLAQDRDWWCNRVSFVCLSTNDRSFFYVTAFLRFFFIQ